MKYSDYFHLVGFEWYLKDPGSQGKTIQTIYCDKSLFVIRHGNKSKAFALLCLKIPDDLDTLDRTKWSEQLPQDVFLCLWSEIVDKDTPSCAREGIAWARWSGWQQGTGSKETCLEGRVSENRDSKTCLQWPPLYAPQQLPKISKASTKWQNFKLIQIQNICITRRQILGFSKLKDFADDNLKFEENGRKLFKLVENTVGIGEIAHYEQFLLFP